MTAIASAHKVIVEAEDAALEETGDLHVPIQEGVFPKTGNHAELGKVVSGERPGSESDEEIIVFKSVDLAIAYIVVDKYLYDKSDLKTMQA